MTARHSRRQLFETLVACLRGNDSDLQPDRCDEAFWKEALPLADLHKVVPALANSLQATGDWERLPQDIRTFLSAVCELNRDRNTALADQGLGILSSLNQAGIRAVPLKGLAYDAIGIHDPLESRLTGDIDILVSKDDLTTAYDLLIEQGYVPLTDAPLNEAIEHHPPLLKPPEGTDLPASVDVHFRLGRKRHLSLLPPNEILANSRECQTRGHSIRVPLPRDLLQHAVIHSGLQNRYYSRRTTRLRDVLDVGRLWERTKQEGMQISDLPISRHRKAAAYFGACLLFYGIAPEELGPISDSGQRCYARILQRQAIAERPLLESSILANIEGLLERPLFVIGKFASMPHYRKFIDRLHSRSV